MKKLYYKIYVRIGKCNGKKEKDFFYFSDGYIVIENNAFEGFLTYDIITGKIDDNKLLINIVNYDKNEESTSYSDEFDSITFPELYRLLCDDDIGTFMEINFAEKITDIEEHKKIEEEITAVRKIHPIP